MITAKLFFKEIDVDQIVKDWRQLPGPIRPIWFNEDEDKFIRGNLISDEEKFGSFKKNNPLGFFLCAENKTLFDISKHSVGYADVSISLEDSFLSDFIIQFFLTLVSHNPIFGYACEWSEHDHRNRYYITIGKNHIEDWVGRKLDKYIPGVYWYTLLSDELLDKHRVKLTDLSSEAISNEALGDGSLHLLKFYERPEAWKENAKRLDNLCEKVSGMFSRRSVEVAVQGVSNYLEYDEIIANWR